MDCSLKILHLLEMVTQPISFHTYPKLDFTCLFCFFVCFLIFPNQFFILLANKAFLKHHQYLTVIASILSTDDWFLLQSGSLILPILVNDTSPLPASQARRLHHGRGHFWPPNPSSPILTITHSVLALYPHCYTSA